MSARTLFEKVWSDHVIVVSPQGEELLYVDFNLINEGQSFLAFDQLRMEGRTARRPQQHLAVTDHYLPTINRDRGPAGMPNPEIRRVVEMMEENAKEFKLPHIGWSHRDQGIAHVISPELGISQPGTLITCNDSHTATNGACGVLAVPIGGGNQLRHVVATQTVWLKKPGTMRISISGTLPEAVTAKDVILSIIQNIGVGGATGYAVEYAGSAISAMSMEGRLTICNMSIEAGARIGMIAPDDTTYQFLSGRRHAPRGADWDKALAYWAALPTDAEAQFDRELSFDAARLAPMVTWGTSPEDCSPVNGVVPDPSGIGDGDRRRHVERALDYMKLKPATPLQEIAIDRVFIGSCTTAHRGPPRGGKRSQGRRVSVPGMVSPGSHGVKRQAEVKGPSIFLDAGLEWRDPGCSMCNGSNGELVAPGERCASTTNRNFEGRQGRGALTHIMSPAMVAAAAVFGRLADVRQMTR
jgi:3-isopropylmalate/(R)-2-methylmalate dehydratase large subunit